MPTIGRSLPDCTFAGWPSAADVATMSLSWGSGPPLWVLCSACRGRGAGSAQTKSSSSSRNSKGRPAGGSAAAFPASPSSSCCSTSRADAKPALDLFARAPGLRGLAIGIQRPRRGTVPRLTPGGPHSLASGPVRCWSASARAGLRRSASSTSSPWICLRRA